MLRHTLKRIVENGNMAEMTHVCAGIAYYQINVEDSAYQLAINSMDDEWKSTHMYPKFKAITLMRWIRKAIETETLIQLK
jgi:hypothetical protein